MNWTETRTLCSLRYECDLGEKVSRTFAMQNFSAASPLRGSGADRSDTASLVSEMPSALKKRFLGLAAVAGVIFLINFPSPTAVAAVCAILITGVVLTWSDSSISNSSKTSSEEFRRQKLEKALQNFRQNGFSAQTADLKVNGQDPLADVKTNGTAKTTSQKMDGDLKIDGVPIPKTRENGKEINGQVQDSRQNGSQMSDLRSNGAVEDSGVPAEALGLKANGAQKSVGHGVETKLDKAQNPVSGMSSQLTSGTDNPALDAKINTQATGLGASQGNGHAKAPAVIPSKNQHKAANGTGEQTQKVVIPEQPVAVHKVEPSARKAPALAGGAAVLARLRWAYPRWHHSDNSISKDLWHLILSSFVISWYTQHGNDCCQVYCIKSWEGVVAFEEQTWNRSDYCDGIASGV